MRNKLFKVLRENPDLVTICSGTSDADYWHFCYSGIAKNHFCIMNYHDKITFQRTVLVRRSDFGCVSDDTFEIEEFLTAEEILQMDDFGKDIKDFVIFNLDLFT
jgi:hypothetical protein